MVEEEEDTGILVRVGWVVIWWEMVHNANRSQEVTYICNLFLADSWFLWMCRFLGPTFRSIIFTD